MLPMPNHQPKINFLLCKSFCSQKRKLFEREYSMKSFTKKPKLKALSIYTAVVLLSFAYAEASHAETFSCSSAIETSEKFENLINDLSSDQVGVFSKNAAGKIIKEKIKSARETTGEVLELCAVIQGKDPIDAYFYALNKLASSAGPLGGYMKQQVKAGQAILAAGRKIANSEGFSRLNLDYGFLTFDIKIENDSWFYNNTMSMTKARNKIRAIKLVAKTAYGNIEGDLSEVTEPTAPCIERANNPAYDCSYWMTRYKNGGYGGALKYQIGGFSYPDQVVFFHVEFVDGNKIYIPLASGQPGLTVSNNSVELTFISYSDGQFALKN
jgi:hypothetical protein